MIASNYIFDDISGMQSVWVSDVNCDVTDLARVANSAIDMNAKFVSVPDGGVDPIWPWLEKSRVKILRRFNFTMVDDIDVMHAMSKLSSDVTHAFKTGAAGGQIFINISDLNDFIDNFCPIKADLFFNHYLSIGINLDDANKTDWPDVFAILRRIEPDSVLIKADGDSFDAASDFVGRGYDMLNKWDINTDLHIMFGRNMLRVSQMLRLVQKIQPKLVEKMQVFITD